MGIPLEINDDIIISNNDKGNDVSNGTEDRSQVFSPLIKYHLIHHCIGGVSALIEQQQQLLGRTK